VPVKAREDLGEEGSASVAFAALLRQFRLRAGLSQQMLADRAMLSVQAVSALERGYRKVPYRETLERLADALSLTAEARVALERSARRARSSRTAEPEAPPPHNLPRQLTSFLGRDDVVKDIGELLLNAPLVSIVGTGGAGKTRTAIAVGMQLLHHFPDGIWFVELASVSDPQLVVQAVGSTLGVQESPRRPLLDSIMSYLSDKRILLVFDNCEHVVNETRRVVGSLLRENPTVSLLATSRESLTIAGERVFRIPPLAVPPKGVTSPEEAITFGSVALFADRVRDTDAVFAVNAANVAPIVEICRRLDGLPLALELAAARATVLSPKQIAERLDRAFEVLSFRDERGPERHQTMRAVIDWSYALLSSQARLLFDRLSIFAGSFTLETTNVACSDATLPEGDVLQTLGSLIAQSLVAVDFSRGEARYHLLEITRQYARERLTERGETELLAHRHAAACLQIAQRLDRDWYTAHEGTWLNEAEAELDNFRAALAWSLGKGNDPEVGCRLAAAMARIWYSLSPLEGRRWIRLAAESPIAQAAPSIRAALLFADAELSSALGEYSASLASARQALELKDSMNDLQTACARQAAGSALSALGETDEGEALLTAALEYATQVRNRRLQGLVLGDLGTARSRNGDIEGARRFYAEALAHYIPLGFERPAASIAGHLAEVEFASGDVDAALARVEEARVGHEATRNRRSAANDLCNMAAYLISLNRFDEARRQAMRALSAARDVKATVLTAYILQHMAAIGMLEESANGSLERATMLLGFVDARLAGLEARREFTEQQEYDRMTTSLQAALAKRAGELMALGAKWTEDDAVAVALEL
jgi:predicted ATPase/transcriptional regulator with XRE-family HTH domain